MYYMNSKIFSFRLSEAHLQKLQLLEAVRSRTIGQIIRESIDIYFNLYVDSPPIVISPVVSLGELDEIPQNYFQFCYPDSLDEVEMVSKPS